MIDHGARRLGGVAVAPVGRAQPIAEVGRRAVELGQAAGADRFLIEGDQERQFAPGLVDLLDEILGVGELIGMGNARRVLGDAAVVRELGNGFGVLEARRAQDQPLGLEDGGTSLPQGLRKNVFQQRHGTGSS